MNIQSVLDFIMNGLDGPRPVAFFTLLFVVLIARVMIAMAREIVYWKESYALALGYAGNIKKRGIYRIRCHLTGAEYIGSTKSNFMARWGQHIRELNNNKHVSPRLQEDWNTYGRAGFQFMIVEVLDDDALIVEREKAMLIQRAATIPPILNYNVSNSRVYPVPATPEQGY